MYVTNETSGRMSDDCASAIRIYSARAESLQTGIVLFGDMAKYVDAVVECVDALVKEELHTEVDALIQEVEVFIQGRGIQDSDLTRYVDKVADMYLRRARYDTAREYYKRLLAVTQPRTVDYSKTLERLGVIEYQCTRYAQSASVLLSALENVPEASDSSLRASILGNLGNCYWSTSDLEQAEQYYLQALSINNTACNIKAAASNISNVANIFAQQARYAEACDYYSQAIALNKEQGNTKGLILNYGNLGNVYAIQGQLLEALDSYASALAAARTIDNTHDEAWCLGNIGIIYQDLEEYSQAEQYFCLAIDKYSELGNEDGSAVWLLNLGNSQALRGADDSAYESFAKAYSLYSKIGDRHGQAHTLSQMASLHCKKGEWDAARTHCAEALKEAQEMKDTYTETVCRITLANILMHTNEGTDSEVIDTLHNVLEVSKNIGVSKEQCEIHKLLSDAYSRRNKFDEALHHYIAYHELEKELLRADVQKKAKQLDAERRFAEAEKRRIEATHKQEISARDAEIYRLENVELAAANETITLQNAELIVRQDVINKKNEELKQAIVDLVELKASRKARTYFLFFTLGLFIISDIVIDPMIDMITTSLLFASAIRFGLALAIRPIEVYVEELMVKHKKEEIVKVAVT